MILYNCVGHEIKETDFLNKCINKRKAVYHNCLRAEQGSERLCLFLGCVRLESVDKGKELES